MVKMPLNDYLYQIVEAVVQSATASSVNATYLANNAEVLTAKVPLSGEILRIEGAANLPTHILMMHKAKISTGAVLEMVPMKRTKDGKEEDVGVPSVTLRKEPHSNAVSLFIEMEFKRSEPHEAWELARERATEVTRDNIKTHRQAVNNNNIATQAATVNKNGGTGSPNQ